MTVALNKPTAIQPWIVVISLDDDGDITSPDKLDSVEVNQNEMIWFECSQSAFQIRFEEGPSPLDEGTTIHSKPIGATGFHRAHTKIKDSIVPGNYKYAIQVGSQKLDPVIVVKPPSREDGSG